MRSIDLAYRRASRRWTICAVVVLMVVVLLMVLFTVMSTSARAASLGRVGKTYPVAEADASKYFDAKLAQKKIDPAQIQANIRKQFEEFVSDLPPVPGISTVTAGQTRFFDLTVEMPEDLKDAKGKLVIAKGAKVNAWDYLKVSEYWFILDGRDERQLAMLRRLWAAKQPVKAILVAGSLLELGKRFEQPLYYDYDGSITSYFGITRVPTLLGQDGNRLRLEEIKP